MMLISYVSLVFVLITKSMTMAQMWIKLSAFPLAWYANTLKREICASISKVSLFFVNCQETFLQNIWLILVFYNVCTFYTYTTRAYTYLLSSFITDHVAETTLTKSPNVPTLRYEHNPFALLKDFFFWKRITILFAHFGSTFGRCCCY